MKLITDLHIHSKYSRATARNLDFENLYHAAQIKGLTVVGTGDFTFPAWVDEIETKLEPAEPGLFALKPSIARKIDETIPQKCRRPVRFILQTEISNIYKKEGRVRKNHNLIYFPDLESVKRFNLRLDNIGNIKSDGRPILGLDAAYLLEIMLETSEQGFFVPAHIWTPWFSMFGSKSGFDSMAQCFGPLKKHIFACETGLSSDPPMNWRVKDLDHVRLISNSDAHSPGFLGRNATVFDTDLNYFSMKKALETNDPDAFQGTYDMHPHQGKYHYDGHRKCNVCLNPARTAELGNICPECGKPLTLGVLYRVQELADRPEGYCPENRHGYTSIIPLRDILSEVCGVGPNTKKVSGYYEKAVEALGPELEILTDRTVRELEKSGVPLLAEAVMKMRKGNIRIEPGYDGEYGKVRLFTREERQDLKGEKTLLLISPGPRKKKGVKGSEGPVRKDNQKTLLKKPPKKSAETKGTEAGEWEQKDPGLIQGLNPEQRKAVKTASRAVIIQAGPGTGKTRTLTARIAWLVSEKKVSPDSILALTFTNKAAGELARRIEIFLPKGKKTVMSATFHAFCLKFLKENTGFKAGLADDDLRDELVRKAVEESGVGSGRSLSKRELGKIAYRAGLFIARCKQQLCGPETAFEVFQDSLAKGRFKEVLGDEDDLEIFVSIYRAYQKCCAGSGLVDYEDLIFLCHKNLSHDPDLLDRIHSRFQYVFVDEYQDLNFGQYELVRLLVRQGNLLVIGDPDQSIYGFRGSDHRFFSRFEEDYPGCETIRLKRNYRSTQTILDASCQMISRPDKSGEKRKIISDQETGQKLIIKETPSETAEAVAAGKMIEDLMGGLSFYAMDARTGSGQGDKKEYSFSDFAVLYRTRKQCQAFADVFQKEGIPFQTADKEEELAMEGIREVIAGLKVLTGRSGARDIDILKAWCNTNSHGPREDGPALLTGETAGGIEDLNSPACLETLKARLGLDGLLKGKESIRASYERLRSRAELFPDTGDFLDSLVLDQDPDHLADTVEKVSFMTIHAAKGLEFPVVFVAGCEQGLIPFARDGKTLGDEAEERRLFYVAMTRAKDILCLTYAKKRRIYGTIRKRQRSLFLDDIEQRLADMKLGRARKKKQSKQVQLELF